MASSKRYFGLNPISSSLPSVSTPGPTSTISAI